ncbi:MAG: hypothetical protein A2W85_06100 [Bacteroidetes bacterium GWF2_41_31]|nr:MAG: hypothetical protein A2W85_06100 [Bacteroidetes bacterium GWF2_41_31]
MDYFLITLSGLKKTLSIYIIPIYFILLGDYKLTQSVTMYITAVFETLSNPFCRDRIIQPTNYEN